MGDKHEAPGTRHFSKVFRGPVVRGGPGHPLQNESQIAASCSLYHKEGSRNFLGFFCFWDQHILQLGITLWLMCQVTRGPALNRAEDRKGLCDSSRLQCKQPWLTFGPYDPADPGGIHDGKRCSAELMASLLEESWHRPLGFWSTVMPSAADNCMPIEKQLLAYHWAL